MWSLRYIVIIVISDCGQRVLILVIILRIENRGIMHRGVFGNEIHKLPGIPPLILPLKHFV